MTDGWSDPVGTERLMCAMYGEDLPSGSGGGIGGGGGGRLITNVFAGYIREASGVGTTYPTFTLGTSDFSQEFWVKLAGAGKDPDNSWGFYDLRTDAAGAIIEWRMVGSPDRLFFSSSGEVNPNDPAPGWVHHTLNCDRSGNMDILFDGVSQDTSSIAAQVATNFTARDLEIPTIPSDASGLDKAISIYGPVAMHNRLLTAAEINDSIINRRVNDFGSSITIVRYNWNVQGETGWEHRVDHGNNGVSNDGFYPLGTSTLFNPVAYASPIGVAGTVFVEDLSGNNRHFFPPVRTEYGTASPTWFESAFTIDRFFI